MSGPLDVSFAHLVLVLPSQLQAEARRLPVTLGFSTGSWHDFAQLEPVIDLPGMAGIREGLARARFAHHCGGFWGLTRDRLSDGQSQGVVSTQLVRALKSTWARACAERELVRRTAALADGAWADERQHRTACSRAVTEYLRTSWRKVAWFPVATLSALRRKRSARELALFVRGVACMMLGLQLVDDAMDAGEDRARFGTCVPGQLGLSAADLTYLATGLTDEAGVLFGRARFATLAAWGRGRSATLRRYFGLGSARS